MIDAHCHLSASYNEKTVTPVIERFKNIGGNIVIDVTTSLNDIAISQAIVQTDKKHIYATVGLHPENPKTEKQDLDQVRAEMKELDALFPTLVNIVGIGETGIDHYYFDQVTDKDTYLPVQEELFHLHIELAKKHTLPLVIHARGKTNDDYSTIETCSAIIKEHSFAGKVYFHSFGGTKEIAKMLLDQGFYLGVNGIITFTNTHAIAEAIEFSPLSSLILETDSPYLIPSNLSRTQLMNSRINEPFAIAFTAKRLAALKKVTPEEILKETAKNTMRLFDRIV
jgi:TatD DNase family protein